MQNKQDQLQAHVFVLGRVVSALTRGEPDAAETPMRRFSRATMGGILVAALLVAGFVVTGLIVPGIGAPSWRTPGTLIVEEGTGSRYVLLRGVLHPVVNYASARLLGVNAESTSVPQEKLAGVPHGAPLGIPGAPEALPDPARLGGRDWLVCSSAAKSSKDSSETVRDVTAVDGALRSTAPGSGEAALVQTPDDKLYVVSHGKLLRLPDRSAQLALGYGTADPWPVSALWASAFPKGPDVRAPQVSGRGSPGPRVGDRATRVGDVLRVETGPGSGTQYFLVLAGGLAPLTETQARLATVKAGGETAKVTAAEAASAPQVAAPKKAVELPATPPQLISPSDGVRRMPCVAMALDTGGTVESAQLRFTVADADALTDGEEDAGPTPGEVKPGAGVLASAPAKPGTSIRATYLITDLGVKFSLPSDGTTDPATSLGYANSQRVTIPDALLKLLPTGPELTPSAAEREQSITRSAKSP
ncbi:type VII secretion protein EccB [Streptomyces lydicus]|uniref:type VII secretion protein EccB n=1 Tax=Streptomyces lydicus TaxID=47763 RepID=UPI0036E504BE